MKKRSKKTISILLSLSLLVSVVSVAFSAFAKEEEAYQPSYTENVTSEDVAGMIGDVDLILQKTVMTGSLLESIYKMLPSLSSIVMLGGSSAKASDKAAFYKELYPTRFAELPDGTIVADEVDENGAVVKDGTFTTFFKAHPIEVETIDAFMAELDLIIDMVVCQNLMDGIVFMLYMGAMQDPNVKGFAAGLDEVCKALGIEQTATASSVLGMDTAQGDVAGLRTYLKNITHAVLVTPVDFILTTARNLAITENSALLYSGVDKVLKGLSGVVKALEGIVGGLGVDISAILKTVEELKTGFEALPTMGEEAEKRIDLEKTISSVAGSIEGGLVRVDFVDEGQPLPPAGDALVQVVFEHFDLDKLASVQTNGDALKVLYEYFYRNLGSGSVNDGLLDVAVGLFPLPEEIAQEVSKALMMSEDDLLDYLVDAAAVGAGRVPAKDPEKPTQPGGSTQPTEEQPDTTTTQPDSVTGSETLPEKADSPDTGDTFIAGMAALALLSGAAYVFARKTGKR